MESFANEVDFKQKRYL